jgi:uncharacterized membrane protein
MGSRERRRAQRRKRKQRTAERHATPSQDSPETSEGVRPPAPEPAEQNLKGVRPSLGLDAAAESESARRNREAREALEPLREGERPTVVTVAAVICAVLVALSIAGYALWDVLRDEERPDLIGVIAFVGLIGPMAWGLWKARYWAVLGFQTVLVLVMIASALALLGSFSVGLAIGNLVLLAGAGTLFYFMIKAWARIQMPERAPPR